MEAANAAIVKVISNNNVVTADVKQLIKIDKNNNKKKVNVLKAALLTLFGKPRKTTNCIQAEVIVDANNWTMIVGCVDRSTTDSTNMFLMHDDVKNNMEKVSEENKILVVDQEDHKEDEKLSGSSLCSSECGGGDSRYASALNLQELDKSTNGGSDDDDDDDEEEEIFDDTQGDAMIDMKAEMFIAQFYAQMKIDSEHNHVSNF